MADDQSILACQSVKTCFDCKRTLPVDCFCRRKRKSRSGEVTIVPHTYCRPCHSKRSSEGHKRARAAARAKRQPAPTQVAQKKRRRKMRELIFAAYGDTCACCGEARYEFLAVDHANNDGAAHRREIGKGGGGNKMYQWIINNKFPPGFRILCHNCNQSFGHYGYCPHQREREDAAGGIVATAAS